MLIVADAITALITMHYKYKFKRPRPTQIVPGFMSPIQHGGHASYPSGHSTEAHVFATLLTKVIPSSLGDTTSDGEARSHGRSMSRRQNCAKSRNRRPSLPFGYLCRDNIANAITSNILLSGYLTTFDPLLQRATDEWQSAY